MHVVQMVRGAWEETHPHATLHTRAGHMHRRMQGPDCHCPQALRFPALLLSIKALLGAGKTASESFHRCPGRVITHEG